MTIVTAEKESLVETALVWRSVWLMNDIFSFFMVHGQWSKVEKVERLFFLSSLFSSTDDASQFVRTEVKTAKTSTMNLMARHETFLRDFTALSVQ